MSSGGAEVFAAELAVSYKRKDHDVSLITYAGILNERGKELENYLIENNVKVIDLSLKPKYLLFYYYIKTILTVRPDLVHSNLEQTDLLLIITKIFNKNSKYIRTLHNIKVFKRFPVWLHKLLFKCYDKNIGCSDYTKTHFEIKVLINKIFAINNGVDIDRVGSKTVDTIIQRDENETVFVVIGTSQKRFTQYQKGHDLIFKAFKKIEYKYKIIFLGDLENIDIDFPEEKLNPNYEFVGVTPDVSSFLQRSDYILAASRFEGLPISTIEGVCSGLPLICSNIEGFLPFDKDSTLFFKNENVLDFVNIIQEAIHHKENYKRNALKNKNSYRQQFDIDVVVTKYLNLL